MMAMRNMMTYLESALDDRDLARFQCTCIGVDKFFSKTPLQVASRALHEAVKGPSGRPENYLTIKREISNLTQCIADLSERKEEWAKAATEALNLEIEKRHAALSAPIDALTAQVKELQAYEIITNLFGGQRVVEKLPDFQKFQDKMGLVINDRGRIYAHSLNSFECPPCRGVDDLGRQFFVITGSRKYGPQGEPHVLCDVIFQHHAGNTLYWSVRGDLSTAPCDLVRGGEIRHFHNYRLLKDLIRKKQVFNTLSYFPGAMGITNDITCY